MKPFGLFHLQETIINIVNEGLISRRGIFYKVVSAGFYPSTHDDNYKKLGKVLNDLRDAESLNENNILDATRIRQLPSVWQTPKAFLTAVGSSYRKDLWEDQPIHLEIVSEKDAMSTVLAPVIHQYT